MWGLKSIDLHCQSEKPVELSDGRAKPGEIAKIVQRGNMQISDAQLTLAQAKHVGFSDLTQILFVP